MSTCVACVEARLVDEQEHPIFYLPTVHRVILSLTLGFVVLGLFNQNIILDS